MKFGELFDHIILCAQESKTLYDLNAESESFARLDEIVKSINLLREFYDKYETLRVQSRVGSITPSDSSPRQQPAASVVRKGKQKLEDDPGHSLANVAGQVLLRGPGSARQGGDAGAASIIKRRRKEEPTTDGDVPDEIVHHALEIPTEMLDKELKNKLELALLTFLEKVCADEQYADAMGMKLHHSVSENSRPRKAIKEGLYFPFRLRIGPLINAFTDEVKSKNVIPDGDHLPALVKAFLTTSRFFKRFNDENKRLKMRGVHVWVVEAANTLQGRWLFHDFLLRFVSDPPLTATIGQRYTYVPKVWDPELCEPEVIITSTHLPPWLTLVNNILLGVPDETAETTEIRLTAMTLPGGRGRKFRARPGSTARRARLRPDPTRTVEQVFKLHIRGGSGDVHLGGHDGHLALGSDLGDAGSSAGGSDASAVIQRALGISPSPRSIVVPVPRRPGGA